MNAPRFHCGDFAFRGLALGIVTPGAGEWAALEECGGAQARAVLQREALDIEDAPMQHFPQKNLLRAASVRLML
jgi:hypothetical protein